MTMTVGNLKNYLNKVLEIIEDCEPEKELQLQGNTYFTRGNDYVLQTPNGFLGLDDLEEVINGEDNEGEEDDAE